jgi:hypothetical protein
LLLVLLLSACAAETTPGRDDAQIYAAAIRQQYGVDDTFGGTLQPPLVYLVRQTNDAIGDPDIPQSESVSLSAEIQAGISAALADLPAEIIWVDNRADVPLDSATGSVTGDSVAGHGVIIEMGNIHEGDGDTLLLSTSI